MAMAAAKAMVTATATVTAGGGGGGDGGNGDDTTTAATAGDDDGGNVGCFKRSLIYKGTSNQLMSTSTEQGKKAGVFSCQNPREIWLDRST